MNIRDATPADVALIYQFIQKKSEFDRSVGAYSGILGTSPAKIQQTLFGPTSFAQVLLAEYHNQAIGFALYGFRYSSFAGQPSIWLDDLFVEATQRSQGAGAALMAQLAQIAQSHNCAHLAWTADDRNPRGLQFYDRLGAAIIDRQGHRCYLQWMPSRPPAT
ncbi:GNAT family N-acetyltransferase [filamentous cyanobacterium LEGE 11480]|uniref:GNAT family N-acetyltransferase n=1 Tax=Romeriopsis navalis LEGE 11480 TaxID=2777977 RepID=A0A928Z485_9CYAN|nr:GNAT family N-acetyltransferase [Romeriopsis navalis]MBE9030005.1 GNAT family N-acetyltransferase [Romeriopsis navalis LEGE 11480]